MLCSEESGPPVDDSSWAEPESVPAGEGMNSFTMPGMPSEPVSDNAGNRNTYGFAFMNLGTFPHI